MSNSNGTYGFDKYAQERFAANDWADREAAPIVKGDTVVMEHGGKTYEGTVVAVGKRVAIEITGETRLGLVGTAEAAELLNVERPRIGRWVGKGQMPEPVQILRASPVWRRSDIEAMREKVDERKKKRAGA